MEKQKERTVQLPKEAIRQLIKSEQFQNTGDIMTCIKDMFKQVLTVIVCILRLFTAFMLVVSKHIIHLYFQHFLQFILILRYSAALFTK